MQNKLQELTDKLYNEGLSKGKQEAELMKANAKNEAADIIAKAKEEAEQILNRAKSEAAELKSKTENDIKMASVQAFAAVKQQIENVIVTKALAQPVKAAVSETDFIKTIITAIVSAFNPNEADAVALDVILPADKKAELEQFMAQNISGICKAGINVEYSKNIAGGFKIGPKGEGYMISFTDKDFENIIAQYLRPKTKELLFG